MAPKPYVVVVGMDFSELADKALVAAFELTSLRENAEIHAVSIVSPPVLAPGVDAVVLPEVSDPFGGLMERLSGHVQALLGSFQALRANDARPVCTRVVSHVRMDSPGFGLAQVASDLEASLIVIGTHGRRGLVRLLMGSVAETTLRYARCPVLVVPPQEQLVELKIEPPCSECVIARSASGGQELWCAQHSQRHGRRHTYHQSARSGAETNFPLVFQ